MSDPDPRVCEVCGAKPLVKVLHPVPIHFKGSGFYSTDYGRGGRKRDSSDSSPADGGKKDESVKKVDKSDKSKSDRSGGERVLSGAAAIHFRHDRVTDTSRISR